MPVEYSQYWICVDDVAEGDSNAVDILSGLAQWQVGEVIVTAADQDRSVDIDLEWSDGPPADAPSAQWQDVVEFSLTTAAGELRLLALLDGARGPNLARDGAGAYRLRLSAADRDPVDGKKPRERHRLQIWRAAPSDPVVLRASSQFAADWDAPPPPPREVDWAALAAGVGTRLLVDWWNVEPRPADEPVTTVVVTDVLSGSPGQVFNRFAGQNPGYLARGMIGGGGGYIEGPFWFRSKDGPSKDHLSSLMMHVDDSHEQRFSHVSFTWGFDERRRTEEPATGDRQIRFRDWPSRPHPFPPGSLAVEIDFANHPDGRQVSIQIHRVPLTLSEDVTALWRLILAGNRTADHVAWPWSV
jgi:hypothetical protein